ncbi:MAG: RNA polymerase subunit sigma, partial [Candidatus Eremiobacteraeota bacterium]|nr:RNA polymerase subunit sigma [Candidatus Eremiobacteraeota bacterium]
MDADFQEEALPHLDALYRYALRLTRNDKDAEDLLQDTFLRAYRFWEKYKKGSNCKAWLFRIMKNQFLN